jgi:hypothetical protein
MNEYVIYLRNGDTATIRAQSFTKTKFEVLFYDGSVVRERNNDPSFDDAIAVFLHEEISGFARAEHVVT